MQNKQLWILIVLCLGFTACDSNQVFDEYRSVSNSWHKDAVMEFTIKPIDSVTPYNLFVNLRNDSNYKYSNLFLIVEMDFPNGKITKDTLEYEMTKPDGTFLGTGFSDVKENKLWYKENLVFKEQGDYLIKIQHAMRENGKTQGVLELEGITDVGFRIEKTAN